MSNIDPVTRAGASYLGVGYGGVIVYDNGDSRIDDVSLTVLP
jgi:hypothetical protein